MGLQGVKGKNKKGKLAYKKVGYFELNYYEYIVKTLLKCGTYCGRGIKGLFSI